MSASALGLLAYRIVVNDSLRYGFMIWNLVLAWIPLLLGVWLCEALRSYRRLTPATLLKAGLWLLFLPNSFYLMTDLVHIKTAPTSLVLYDATMLFLFALTGLLIGCTSLYSIHELLNKKMKIRAAWAVIVVVIMLASVALFLGRYVDWNSWDVFFSPLYILLDLSERVTDSGTLRVTSGTILLFFVATFATYTAFYLAHTLKKSSK
jgi:uncharacterized membrane protein